MGRRRGPCFLLLSRRRLRLGSPFIVFFGCVLIHFYVSKPKASNSYFLCKFVGDIGGRIGRLTTKTAASTMHDRRRRVHPRRTAQSEPVDGATAGHFCGEITEATRGWFLRNRDLDGAMSDASCCGGRLLLRYSRQ